MNDRIYLLVRCTVKTKHRLIHDAIKELQDGTELQLTSTENVEILHTEIVKMNTKSKN